MNKTSLSLIEAVRCDKTFCTHADDPEKILIELRRRWLLHREVILWELTMRTWAVYDEHMLHQIFQQFCNGNGFDFDVFAIDQEDRPWAAAYQLVIEDFKAGRRELEMPDISLEEVEQYISLVPAARPDPKSGGLVQQALFSQLSLT